MSDDVADAMAYGRQKWPGLPDDAVRTMLALIGYRHLLALDERRTEDRRFWHRMATTDFTETADDLRERAEWALVDTGPTDTDVAAAQARDRLAGKPTGYHFPPDYLERLRLGLPQTYELTAHPETEELVRKHLEQHNELLDRIEKELEDT